MDRETEGTLLAFVVLLLLGLEPVVIKANPVNPFAFASLSALIASLILWPVILLGGQAREIRERPAELRKAFLTGLFATAVAYSLFAYGTRLSTAINSAILTRFEVFYSFLISWLLLGERISGRAVVSALALITGVFLVVAQGKRPELLKGDILLLLTPLFWQLGHAIAKRTDYSPVTIATLRNTSGGLLLLVPAFITGFAFTKLALAEGLIIALTQSLWYLAIARINLSKATAILTPAPALTGLVSIALLGERVTFYHLAGLALIILGTLVVSREESGVRE
ncbi:DMT family transporter [Thermococcus sp. AM4]|uniref:DMT family transporter n=1 Tax=Thermococcus sp. (strain AM4) TaxID=246969 RepID=UPI0001870A71|nr:DMT family transporter [Thermococcus sp. AM4]EEB73469.1 permease drug/metabolite transporter, DMT superfamily [Thermococcus sp. AM4]